MNDHHEREEMLSNLVHLCDIGACTYQWDECVRWARMIMTEMNTQVFREDAIGLPLSTYMDLGKDDVPITFAKGQVGFIAFVLIPFFNLFPPHIPELQGAVDTLKVNKDTWVTISEKTAKLPPAVQGDDEKLSWSVNVGYVALGPTSDVLRGATVVDVLMSTKNEEYAKTESA